MRILVCLKLIAQMQFTDFLTGCGDERLKSGQLELNPADCYALELALRIKDQRPESEITLLSMAPPAAESALRGALAMGADRAVLVSDGAFAGSDTLMTSYVLARAIGLLAPQALILCGRKALDSETGHIAPQLAARLGLPCATNIVDFTAAGAQLLMTRAQDEGLVRLSARPPLVLSVCNGTGMVRKPSILGLRRSAGLEIERFDRARLGLRPGLSGKNDSGTETIAVRDIAFSARAHTQTQSIEAGGARLLAWVKGEAGL